MSPGIGSVEELGAERLMLLSAVVPGTGQFVRGQRRWAAYVAAEIASWFVVVERRRAGGRLRDRYRELAWSVAREDLTEGPRRDGDFGYYEDLSHWERSGAFDHDAGAPGIQPETDPGTFNGSIWELARDLHFPPGEPEPASGDPVYRRALDYYRDRAYPPGYLWDWSTDPGSWARYGETIEESDARFRQATLFTGVVVANHLLSAVDAFVSARLSEAAGRSTDLRARLGVGSGGDWARTRLDLTLTFYPRSP